MSGDVDTESDHLFASWNDQSAIEITPSTTELTPEHLTSSLKRWYDILEEGVLDCRIIIENGECRYSVSASDGVLDRLEPTLRQALPNYEISRTDSRLPPAVDADSLTGIRFKGQGERWDDWHTGLQPLDGEGSIADARPALTAAVDAVADTEATVVYQALIRQKPGWRTDAEDRRYDLKQNRDTFSMRFIEDYVLPIDPEKEVDTDSVHVERIEQIDAAEPDHSFDVAVRAIAYGPEADEALSNFKSPMKGADQRYYGIRPVPVSDPMALTKEMADQTIPQLSWLRRTARRACGSGVKPTLVADPRTLGQLTLVDGAELTDAGRRMLSTTPDERTRLNHPEPEVLAQYEEGFTVGQLQQQDADNLVPNIVAVPPLMQRMHLLVIGKSGSGKSSLLVRGALDNHAVTDGLSILIDGKGDGLPHEYMQAHYMRYGTLDNIVHFDCSELLPALSFFDVRPYLDDGTDRVTAIEDIADHYLELVRAMMGTEGFDRAVRSPDIIRYLIKALFDPVHGQDAFSHRELQHAAVEMKATGDAPPVTDEELEQMLSGVTTNSTKTFEAVMSGVDSRLDKIPNDSRLSQLFNHVPEDDDPHFDFYDLLNEDTVVIFDTSSLRSKPQEALTLVLLSNLWSALKRRASEQPEADRKLVNLYLEEAANVGTSNLVTELLSQGRGFGLSVMLSMQFPEQLRAANPRAYAEVLNNVSTVVSGNVSVDADLARRFATSDMSPGDASNRLRALKRGEWLVSLPSAFGIPEPRPFTLESTPLPDGLPESDRPFTPAMRTSFEAMAEFVAEDTREHYGIDVTAPRHSYEQTSDESTPADRHHVLEYTRRLPNGIECDTAANAFTCGHCGARYQLSRDGLLRAVDCCYGLDRIDRDDVPLCSLSLTLTDEERTASGYTPEQLYFLQAVYDAHQQRFNIEWEYDIVSDSMVRLQEYTGIEPAAVSELIDDGLLAHDCDYPHKLYTVTAAGRSVLKEAHKRGVAHGDGQGDLGESSLHVAMDEVLYRHIIQTFVDDPDSPVIEAQKYYDLEDGTRLDAVGLDPEGDVVVAAEAERVNHDVLEAAPSDFDKMAACNPTHAIWLTENREDAHTILQTLNDPKEGPPRIEETYSESSQPQRLVIDSPGMTNIYGFRYLRDTLWCND